MQTLPPILRTSEPGSFAQRTFQTRIPRIVSDVIATNPDYAPEIVAALESLRAEIISGTVQPLHQATDDAAMWNASARAHLGKTWLDVPWFWAETFFYRRILEAVRYFQPGATYGRDPFAPVKRAELKPDRAPRTLAAALEKMPAETETAFPAFVHACLWGNRTDLSYLEIKRDTASLEHERENLLVDDTAQIWDHMRAQPGRVDFICDNAGTELLFDLALADFLLHAKLATHIVLRLKPQPFFVSDTMIADVHQAFDALSQSFAAPLQALTHRLARALDDGRLRLTDHPFWISSNFFHTLPADLRADLAAATLVIVKGDANYRRLIGDCRWEPTTPFADVVAYFPAPVVALRTLKAELIVGLARGEADRLRNQDPSWLVNGKRGVIQFAAREPHQIKTLP